VPHSDDESLSLLALGEPVTDEVRTHVAGCDRCAAHVRELAALVGVVRADLPWPAGVQPVPPPPQVWSAIAASTGVRVPPRPSEVRRRADALAAATRPAEAAPAPVTPASGTPAVATPPSLPAVTTPPSLPAVTTPPAPPADASPPTGVPVATPAPAPAAPAIEGLEPPRPIRPPRPPEHRGASGFMVFLVAAATLAIGVAAGVAGERILRGGDDVTPSARNRVLAEATLDGLPAAPSAGGTAEVVQTSNGRRLDVDVSRLGAAQGFYEVWLIDKDVKRMVPVGILRGDNGEYELPDGVDLATYPIVDISVEPLDGNPAHSGESVLRGTVG
jgi:hypothetical protein